MSDLPNAPVHISVMLNEVLEQLSPTSNETYLDGTFGAGGYSRAILEAADCNLYAIDRDIEAQSRALPLNEDFPNRFKLLQGCFGDMQTLLESASVESLDGVVLDIGVSSPQIDDASRGFSFREDGPLDMRMGDTGPTAADIVNNWSQEELARVIYEYGEERHSRKIASAIVMDREKTPFTTTQQLAGLLRRIVPKSKDKLDQATRTFQALRIQVNDELGELERALLAAEKLLKPGGRLVVVSFHSLEDRIVKKFMNARSGKGGGGNRHLPIQADEGNKASFTLATRSAMKPSKRECGDNPRSRSAKLRAAIRTNAPIWGGKEAT